MMVNTRLFVGNLPNKTKEKDLRSAFKHYGEVSKLEIKSKSDTENDPKKFAFITLSGHNTDVESCIKFFGSNDFQGSRLYVSIARESFLERLQRERELANTKASEKNVREEFKGDPAINLGDKLNPKKRKAEIYQPTHQYACQIEPNITITKINLRRPSVKCQSDEQNESAAEKKRQESDYKRMESMKKKRQEFQNKKNIIKIGLVGIDKVLNKILKFSDNEEDTSEKPSDSKIEKPKKSNILFDDDDEDDDNSDSDINFGIKKQYEGKKGQKVLDLQSRYKSDKRFVLDERFIEEEEEEKDTEGYPAEQIDVNQGDEKSKQIKILEDVLGVAIKSHVNKPEKDRKTKPNMGMIRFDPMNPEHAKFVVPIEEVKQETKKAKKSKTKQLAEPAQPAQEGQKVEVSKEQFYKSEITREAFEQPATGFTLRSLFTKEDESTTDQPNQQDPGENYLSLQPQKQQKVKNPLDPGEKNPFVYDSSESEAEDESKDLKRGAEIRNSFPEVSEVKAVWKENLFFSQDDIRLQDGLAFFNNVTARGAPKERRELKSVMMKRIHNSERKNQMFKRKIGGRKKTMKKSYR